MQERIKVLTYRGDKEWLDKTYANSYVQIGETKEVGPGRFITAQTYPLVYAPPKTYNIMSDTYNDVTQDQVHAWERLQEAYGKVRIAVRQAQVAGKFDPLNTLGDLLSSLEEIQVSLQTNSATAQASLEASQNG